MDKEDNKEEMRMRKNKLKQVVSLAMVGAMVLTPASVLAGWKKPTTISKISATSKTVRAGQEFELKVYSGERNVDDDYFVWSIDNKSIVRFDDDDRYDDEMEFKALKAGTATITCKIKGTNVKKTCVVKVTEKQKTPYITIDDDDERFTVDVYDRENLEARLRNATTSNRGLNYKSLDTDIVTVDSRGNVYGKKVGKGRIQISSKADPSIKKTVTVYVEWDD